jgi:hypothetical protein
MAPLQGGSVGVCFLGLKPQAESYSPFRARNFVPFRLANTFGFTQAAR